MIFKTIKKAVRLFQDLWEPLGKKRVDMAASDLQAVAVHGFLHLSGRHAKAHAVILGGIVVSGLYVLIAQFRHSF